MKNFNFKYLSLTVMMMFIFLFNSCYLDEESVHGTLEKTFPVKEGGNLLVNTDIGSIEVDTGSEPMVSIKVFRKVRSSSRKKAERILGDFVVDMRKEGNDVMVTADYKHSRRWFSWFQSNRLSVGFADIGRENNGKRPGRGSEKPDIGRKPEIRDDQGPGLRADIGRKHSIERLPGRS
jgi:hypothetical protein